MMGSESPKTNYRLLRIAESICSSVLTDGFCGPRNCPDCRCWNIARAVVQGLENQSDPCLRDAWPNIHASEFETDEIERRAYLQRLCVAIRTKRDELTAEHEATNQSVSG